MPAIANNLFLILNLLGLLALTVDSINHLLGYTYLYADSSKLDVKTQ